MNRNEEYNELMRTLDDSPLKLDYTLERARARKAAHDRAKRTKKTIFIPLGTLAAVFALFVALVNVSPTFADAVGDIPALARLAEAVSFSPSLKTAIDNDYIQEINQEQTENGITAKLEYLIVDEKQAVIFYSLSGEKSQNVEVTPELKSRKGFSLMSFNSDDTAENKLRRIIINYAEDYSLPETLELSLSIYDSAIHEGGNLEGEEYEKFLADNLLAEFDFSISLDPTLIAEKKTIEVGRSFELDGQSLTLEKVEIYPTHMSVFFGEGADNTAWLKGLSLTVADESGNEYETSGGISATGATGTRSMLVYYLDSSYFTGSRHLTAKISGAKWRDKDITRAHIDLKTETAEDLPEGVELASVTRDGNDYVLQFSVEKAMPWGLGAYWDYDGKCDSISVSGQAPNLDTPYIETATIRGFTGSELWLTPEITAFTSLYKPIEIKIK